MLIRSRGKREASIGNMNKKLIGKEESTMFKKTLAMLLAALMVVGMLAGCGNSQPTATDAANQTTQNAETTETAAAQTEAEKPSGTLTWLTNSAYGDVPQSLADAYMEYNPNAQVVIEAYTRTELMKVIDIKIGAGDAGYDVLFVDQPLVASYFWKDYLLPLDDYFSEDELSVFTKADLGSGYVENSLQAVPLTSSSQVLMVNRDLLKEAGLSLDESVLDLSDRLTWEELVDLATQFQEKMDPDHSKGYWGFVFGQQSNAYQILALGNSLGEKAIADDGVTVEGVLNTEGWEKALTFYQDLYTKYEVSPVGSTDDEVKSLFYSGKILFYVANTIRAAAADFDIAGILHPYFEGGQVTVPTGSWYLGINKNSQNVDLAVDFLHFCTTGEGAELWMLNNNQVPARVDLLANITEGKYDAFTQWPGYATTIAAMENLAGVGYARPTSYGWGSFDTIFSNMLADLRSGADVKTSLDAAAAQLQTDFNQYK